jgi:hypothetical protein
MLAGAHHRVQGSTHTDPHLRGSHRYGIGDGPGTLPTDFVLTEVAS